MSSYSTHLIGEHIAEYCLLRHLGRGGFGEVYLAEHVRHKTLVAIKLASKDLNPSNITTAFSEARGALLDHPNIVRVRDFGLHNGYPYYVMNYLAQGDLRQRHPHTTTVPWPTIYSYATQVAEALQYIHEKGLVHRDLKPENILINDNGDIQISDFGIATTSYTINQQHHPAQGTISYIAPEQIKGRSVRASDQYSLGAILYEWLTGVPPFIGSVEGVLNSHLYVQPIPLRERDPTIPEAVEALIMRTLYKLPEQRFASMREFIVALEQTKTPPLPFKERFFTEHTHAVLALSWSTPLNMLASAGHDKTVHIWQPASGQSLYQYHGHTGEVWSVMWSPDGKSLLSGGSDEIIQRWEPTTAHLLASYMGQQGAIHAVAWSPDGTHFASAGYNPEIQVWDINQDHPIYTYHDHRDSVFTLAWSPNGRTIASGGNDSTVRIWQASTGAYEAVYRGHTDRITSLAWSPDGRTLASASDDGTIHLWQTSTNQQVAIYTEHTQTVTAIAWSPNGRYLASTSWDKTMRLWDVQQDLCIYTYHGHKQWVNAVAWSPDNAYIASASWDKTVHLLSLSSILPTI